MFAAASLASGLATSPGLLIAARGVQGVGGAAMFATTIALLNASYQGRDRGTAFGVWGAVAGGSAAVGPVLGGLLTEALSAVAHGPAGQRGQPLDPAQPGARSPLPQPGPTGGRAALRRCAAATTFGLVRASSVGWAAAQTVGLIAAGLAAFVVFVLIESRARQPLLQVSLLRRPAFAAVMIAALLLNAAAFAYLAYSSLWLQTVLGLSPVQAGLAGAAPMSLSAFVVSVAIGRFLHASNPRWIIGGGMALVGAGALLQAGLGAGSAWTHLVPGLIVAGIGVGLATPTLVSSAMSAVPVRSGGMAAGAVNTMRQLGYAFGIAVLGSVFSARVAHVVVAPGRPSGRGPGHLGGPGPAAAGQRARGPAGRAGPGRARGLGRRAQRGVPARRGARPGGQRDRAGRPAPPAAPGLPRPGAGQPAARPEAVQPDVGPPRPSRPRRAPIDAPG